MSQLAHDSDAAQLQARLETRPTFDRKYRSVASVSTGFVCVSIEARRRSGQVDVRVSATPSECDYPPEVRRFSARALDAEAVDQLLIDVVEENNWEAVEVRHGREVRRAAERLGRAPWSNGRLRDLVVQRENDPNLRLFGSEIIELILSGSPPRTSAECDKAWNLYEFTFGWRI